MAGSLGVSGATSPSASLSSSYFNQLIALQVLGLGPITDLLIRPLKSALATAGIVVFVVSLIFSLLFYSVGRLLGIVAGLVRRVTQLESTLATSAEETGSASPEQI